LGIVGVGDGYRLAPAGDGERQADNAETDNPAGQDLSGRHCVIVGVVAHPIFLFQATARTFVAEGGAMNSGPTGSRMFRARMASIARIAASSSDQLKISSRPSD
jgi:hypothetical protein